jgi:hypothetical protein
MNEKDPTHRSDEKWFLPPEGVLDGDEFEIAHRFIDGARNDLEFNSGDNMINPELRARHAAIRPAMEAFLDSQEAKLKAGDAQLAWLLMKRVEREVDELNRGERTTVTGQAHVFSERFL